MALTTLELNTISRGLIAARLVLNDLKPVIDQLNILYDSGGGLKTTIDQAGLDAVPAFSGLTKTQLDDGFFALTSTLRTDINNVFTQLAQLAARA